jgi:hypothetical protein
MADGEVFTAATGQGLVVSTGILGDLVLPEGAFDPDRADEIRELAAQAAVYATQACGPGTLRAYRSAWHQYDAWCARLGLPALSGDPRLVGLSLDPGHPSIALLLDGIRRRRGTRPAVGQGGGPAGQGHRRGGRRRCPGLMERTFGNLAVSVQRSYSGHSLRAGLATAAAEAEAQLHDVMRQTRHKSVEVARRYMRSADLWRNNVTEKVMRPRT